MNFIQRPNLRQLVFACMCHLGHPVILHILDSLAKYCPQVVRSCSFTKVQSTSSTCHFLKLPCSTLLTILDLMASTYGVNMFTAFWGLLGRSCLQPNKICQKKKRRLAITKLPCKGKVMTPVGEVSGGTRMIRYCSRRTANHPSSAGQCNAPDSSLGQKAGC